MEKVTNKGEGTGGFKDDDGKSQTLKSGESVECNYKRSMDERFVIEKIEKKTIKKIKQEAK